MVKSRSTIQQYKLQQATHTQEAQMPMRMTNNVAVHK
jgi:hypothetical protein